MGDSWVSNRYLRATRGNFTLAATIGNDVDAALENQGPSDARIQTLSDYFKTANNAYQRKFALLDAVSGSKEGATHGLKTVLKGMRDQANSWRKAIANVYDERSEEYIALLPDGIGPFTKGKQASIMQAVQGISTRLAGITALSATKASVDATYLLLDTKNSTQKGKKGARNMVSEELEQERINLCNALLYVEGGLMQIFPNEPTQIDVFFPLKLLRRRLQTEFTGSIAAARRKVIVRRKLEAGNEIRLHNIGATSLTFYFAPTKNTRFTSGMTAKTVSPTQDITIPAIEVGSTDENVYLIVMNNSDTATGHWFVGL